MMGHAVDGDFGLELERMPLESATLAWSDSARGPIASW
jgi:hypothetical protein